jgi:Tol biopolymer transport system component
MKGLFSLKLGVSLGLSLGMGWVTLISVGCSITPIGLNSRTDGTERVERLTSDPGEEYAPAWSPDGQSIAYTTKDARGNFDIAVIKASGGQPVRLTSNPTYDGLPAWSPDGQYIAFESDRDFHADIWIMDLDGQNPRKLTFSREGNFTPTWSPDGSRILYELVPLNSDPSGNRELWVMDREGKNTRKLADGFNPEERDLFFTTGHFHSTPPEATRSQPTNILTVSKPYEIFTCGLSWSPDGKRIAFESVRGGSISLWVMNSDGTNPSQLTRDLSNNWHPAWSPDGKRIAFASDRSGNYDIWMMNADGSNPVPLTQDPANDFRPSWSPDGKKIVFTSLRSGTADLWVVKPQL